MEASFFDILVNIFIYRIFSNLVVQVITPFLNSSSPEEARKLLLRSNLHPEIRKTIFTKVSPTFLLMRCKGIVFNCNEDVKRLMLPEGTN